jgi:hypothetical protein
MSKLDHQKTPKVDERMIFKWFVCKLHRVVRTGFIWLRTEASGEF